MSLAYEQYRSLATTRDLLYDLLSPKQRPKTIKELKRRVHQALRHYPPLRENGEPMFSQDNFKI
jgi:hypothetical protein